MLLSSFNSRKEKNATRKCQNCDFRSEFPCEWAIYVKNWCFHSNHRPKLPPRRSFLAPTDCCFYANTWCYLFRTWPFETLSVFLSEPVGSVDDAANITFTSLKRQLLFGESERGRERGARAHERGTDNNELELISGRTSGCIYTHVIVSKICIIDSASRVVRSVIINRLLW